MFDQSAVAITVGQQSCCCLPCPLSNVTDAAQLALELTWLGRTDEGVEEDLEKQCPNLCAPLGTEVEYGPPFFLGQDILGSLV